MHIIRYEKLKEVYEILTYYFPSKLRIFMFGFYIWTWVLLQFVIFANFILKSVITYSPTFFLPDVNPKIPIKIVKAMDDKGNNITKQLKMFMNFKWDPEMCDDAGGIDLDIFAEYIGSAIVWIAYIMEYDIDDKICEKFIEMATKVKKYDETENNKDILSNADTDNDSNLDINISEPNKLNYFKKCIRIICINTSKKIAYKLKKNTTTLDAEDILFGELDFS